jgi:NAD(P)-dependent dehydrogenase (short-subunit alcohol dehydrogenase family)
MNKPVVIVTGASRGLGAAAAILLAAQGAAVVLTARSEADLRAVADDIHTHGGEAHPIVCDVSQPTACQQLVEETLSRYGHLHSIVNNAGVIQPIASIAESNPVHWTENLIINLAGPYYLTRYALPHLRAQRGRVINVSSGAAVMVFEGWSAYAAAKAGLNHFTRALAAEEPDITAIAFRPGKIDTPMQATIRSEGGQGMTAEQHAAFVRFHEQGELASPFAVGRVLAALALHAPHAWSGEFINITEARATALADEHAIVWGGG